ncbi:MAG: glutaminyl-peptide cyclotransferase [Acidobacteria bacterium]|nr:glutaminyl-peptide cyclotransferase [Acidobacteriota bacterium]
MVMAAACLAANLSGAETPRYTARIVMTFPHDTGAFTQGLEFNNGALYESTGMVGHSGIRKVNLTTGKVLQQLRVNPPFFGEGITIINGQLIQLTWQHQTGFVYKFPELQFVKQFSYSGEGWGLTNDGKQIYMSDGTAQIRVWDPATLKEVRRITVQDNGRQVGALNELEWVRGEIWANVWMTDQIVRVSPANGKVLGWIDLADLPRDRSTADVLNGIAYDATTRRLIVTGKLWANIYQIELVPKR